MWSAYFPFIALASSLIDKVIRVNAVAPSRPAQPEKLSPAYVYLASPVCAGYITGSVGA